MPSSRSRTGTAVRNGHPPSHGASPATAGGANTGSTKSNAKGQVVSHPVLVDPARENRVRKIFKLIESEPACSIHDLATRCNLSHSHLQHLFKQQTGIRLGHLMLEQRLLKAARLLENSTLSVKEIAFQVGYEHASSFIRAFARRFALAPRSYRQQKQPQEMLTADLSDGTKC